MIDALPTTETAAVSMRGVHVGRDGWTVLRNVDWELRRGEIHAIVGEHRSGKSTLAGLISGEAAKDAGEIVLDGRRVEFLTPRQARSLGVSVIGQEARLIPGMSVAENIFLGCRSFRPFSGKAMLRDAARELDRLGVDVSPSARLRSLPTGKQRLVEIVKAVVDDPHILILDEVSQRFTPAEMERVHTLLREWRRAGKSAVFISPTLDEALESSDRITFLSGGALLGTEDADKLDRFRVLNFTAPALASREKLREANVELYNYKRYNESLIRNLPLGVIIVDPAGQINLINRAAAEILGVEERAAQGGDTAAIFPSELQTAFNAAAAAPRSEEFDLGPMPVRLTVFPLRDDAAGRLGTVILLENMALDQQMKDYLVRVERIKSAAELAAGAAHEINNPLCVIRNYIELLKRQPHSPEVPKRLNKIGEELDWIVEIVGGMLSFAKPGDSPYRELDLAATIREAALLLHHRFREQGIAAEVNIPSVPLPAIGNENRLKQLFVNLIANAVDAAGPGGRVRATVKPHNGGDYVEARVEDDGPGIPEEVKERMFNPFFTTKTGRHNTGLGLSICQQIVEAHQGLLFVERKDGWTHFVVRFPAVAPAT